jgi:hypothetical protein
MLGGRPASDLSVRKIGNGERLWTVVDPTALGTGFPDD